MEDKDVVELMDHVHRETTWHIDKTISIANVLGIIALCITGFGAYDSITDRMAIIETSMANINERVVQLIERQITVDEHQDTSLLQFRSEMREDVRAIQQKLDRIIEQR